VAAAIAPPIRIPAIGRVERGVKANAPTASRIPVAASAGAAMATSARRRAAGSPCSRPPDVSPA
jgi:hypothetical protein